MWSLVKYNSMETAVDGEVLVASVLGGGLTIILIILIIKAGAHEELLHCELPRCSSPGGGPLWCALALDKVAQPPPVQPELQQPAKVVVVRLVPGKGTGTE